MTAAKTAKKAGTKLLLVKRSKVAAMLPALTAAFVLDELKRANKDCQIDGEVIERHQAAKGVDFIGAWLVRQAVARGAKHTDVLAHLVTYCYPLTRGNMVEQAAAAALDGLITALLDGRVDLGIDPTNKKTWDGPFHVGDVALAISRSLTMPVICPPAFQESAPAIDALQQCANAAAWLVAWEHQQRTAGESSIDRDYALEEAARDIGALYVEQGREKAYLDGLSAFVAEVSP